MNLRKLLLVCVLLGLAWPVAAQTVYPVPSLPRTFTVTVDDADGPNQAVVSYQVTLDGATLSVPPAKPTPCTDCISVPWVILTPGPHTVSVVATNAAGSSPAAALTVIVTVSAAAPNTPTNLRIAMPLVGGVSPSGTLIPPATSLVDATGHTWALGPLVACPGVSTHCFQIVRDDLAIGAVGYKLKIINGQIHILGWEDIWYLVSGSTLPVIATAEGINEPQ